MAVSAVLMVLPLHATAAAGPTAPAADEQEHDTKSVSLEMLPGGAPAHEPDVLVSALFPDGYAPGDADEAVQLWNVGGDTVDLRGWVVDDGEGTASFPYGFALAPGQRIWLARDAAAFHRSFGHEADWAWSSATGSSKRLVTAGGGPALANSGDEVTLRRPDGAPADAVVYGSGMGVAGWSGPPIQPYGTRSIRATNQVLYRKLDPASAAPAPDGDSASDWSGDRLDTELGRRARFPGWDLEGRLVPERTLERGTIEVAVAPDALHAFVRQHLAAATQSIDIMLYSFGNPDLAEVVAGKARRGVRVRILVDGAPVGGIDMAERWCLAHVDAAGGSVYWMDDGGDVRARFRSAHAKLIVIDDREVLIGSENLNLGSTPYDDRADGTAGRRGVYVATNAEGVVRWASELIAADIDPLRHADVRPFQSRDPARGAPAPDFEPLRGGGGTGYDPIAPLPLAVTGVHAFELVSAPENALHGGGGLLGLLAAAGSGDEVLAEQLSEPLWWGGGPSEGDRARNPRVVAYLAAARRGARVRLLLDEYFDDPDDWNGNLTTARYLGQRAAVERLDLDVRLGNPTGQGLHNKMVLVRLDRPEGARHWVHVGSLNGSEVAHKVNREVAVQIESPSIHAYLAAVFSWDWATTNTVWLPIAPRDAPSGWLTDRFHVHQDEPDEFGTGPTKLAR